jgi:hypothetical protein
MQSATAPGVQIAPGAQSASVSHGKAHFPAAVLHRCAPHAESSVQAAAARPGRAREALETRETAAPEGAGEAGAAGAGGAAQAAIAGRRRSARRTSVTRSGFAS